MRKSHLKRLLMTSSTSSTMVGSRALVGSSKSITSGCIASERASVFYEYAMVSSVVIALATLMLNPDSWLFKGLGFDYSIREFLIKFPIL